MNYGNSSNYQQVNSSSSGGGGFGGGSQNYQYSNDMNEFCNSRKIAMVKPELRNSEK